MPNKMGVGDVYVYGATEALYVRGGTRRKERSIFDLGNLKEGGSCGGLASKRVLISNG